MTVGQTFFGARGARIGMALGAALGCVATAGAFDAGGGDMGMGGDMFGGGDVFSGDAFGGDMFGGGDVFSGDAFGGDMFGGGDVFSGDAFDGDMFSADSFGGDLGMDGAGWGLEGFGEEGGLLQDSWFADLGGATSTSVPATRGRTPGDREPRTSPPGSRSGPTWKDPGVMGRTSSSRARSPRPPPSSVRARGGRTLLPPATPSRHCSTAARIRR